MGEDESWQPGGLSGRNVSSSVTKSSGQLYLITLPEQADERRIIEHIRTLGEDRLERVSWGRSRSTTYLILQAQDESEAMNVVPPALRAEAGITSLNNLGEEGVQLEIPAVRPGRNSRMEYDPYGQGSTAAEPPEDVAQEPPGGRPPGDGMTGGSGRSGKKTK